MPQASALDASLVAQIAPTTPLMPLPMPPPTMADAASPQTQIAMVLTKAMVLTNRSMLALLALPLRYFHRPAFSYVGAFEQQIGTPRQTQPSASRYFAWLVTASNKSCATVVTLWIAMLLVAALLVCLYIDVLN